MPELREHVNLNESIKAFYALRNLPDTERKLGVQSILKHAWSLPTKETSLLLSMASMILSGERMLSQSNYSTCAEIIFFRHDDDENLGLPTP